MLQLLVPLTLCFSAMIGDGPDAARLADLAKQLSASAVQVEYMLKYDRGEAPETRGSRRRCPNCGEYHYDDTADVVKEERPMLMPGYALSPNELISTDPIIHPRFVKSIRVRFGQERVRATIAGYAVNQNALLLKLESPMPSLKPLAFDAAKPGPYFAAAYGPGDAHWSMVVQPVSDAVTVRASGEVFRAAASNSVIVDASGTAVGMCFNEELPVDDSWKGPPSKWTILSAEEMNRSLEALREATDQSILRVSLGFRSPKVVDRADAWDYMDEDDGDGNATATEREALGVLFDASHVLVLASLSPKATARLERITVHHPKSKTIAAKFQCSLKDYGAFVATLDASLPTKAAMSTERLETYRQSLLRCMDVVIQGDKRTAYFSHDRLRSLELGWQGRIYPKDRASRETSFWFSRDSAALVALPIERREKLSVREEWSDAAAELTPAAYVAEVLANLSGENIDPSNIPLSEDDEQRIAWLGVELQALDRELARANGVSHLTTNGETGALVTFVHPNSPAAETGVEAGWVLLRLNIAGHPKPLEIQLEEDRYSSMADFPWDQLDEMPEQYFDRLPTPWPSAENQFTRALTELGFGTKFSVDFVDAGVPVTKEYTVVQSPAHFDSAAKFKAEAMGLTVRDLTYEVRRYYQSKPDDPGVVISKIEPGSKAAVAKVLPYELVTHVNGKAIKTVGEFEKAIQGQPQVQLSLKRQSVGRVVKIDLG